MNLFVFITDVKANGNARSPLLAFCDAVMASVSAVGSRPNHKLSDECVECVLNENRLDLLAHWIAQDRYNYFYYKNNYTDSLYRPIQVQVFYN